MMACASAAAPPERVRRPVRSYARREGRMTRAQRGALAAFWGRYGVDFQPRPLDLDALFGRRAPRHLEIGFGMGDALLAMALAHPERDYLGVEVYRPGVGSLLRRLDAGGVENVRVVCADAAEVLRAMIPAGALAAVYLFFPDPWPKKRHHKRRLVQSAFVGLVAERLHPGGLLHMATDWQDYAEHIAAVMEQAPGFRADTEAAQRPPTKFEQRGRRLGHGVWDLRYLRT